MTPLFLLSSLFLGVACVIHVEDTQGQERFFLRALGLSVRPQPAASRAVRRRVPSTLRRMFRRFEDSEGEDSEPCTVSEYGVRGNIIRYVQDQGRLPSVWSAGRRMEQHLFFNMSVLQPEEDLSLAQLEVKLHWKHFSSADLLQRPRPLSVSLYQVIRATLKGFHPEANRRLLLSQSMQPRREPTVLKLDLTAQAQSWRKPGHNLGLLLELIPQDPICRARRLYIDFRDVGWQHWIIAPQGYMANYCRGECPFPLSESLNGTNHAMLQTMVHSLDPHGTPQPCCVPVRLSAMSMLYYDNSDNVVLRHYPNMVVDECGCR
ncbi:hypothetical protein LDENG_00096510 [Lucifuga dentata]|nr:hypothetical protein LDENG_00096510 [Lucifuga dentata]